ncbi:NFACT RNA binding domain-containing protein [Clostridium sp. AM58-1XD]|uniref:Rqc2 family fibronectin-binding protein n=1 Tax=Clostridium sp. AM58-1XD TaxID=2292307 RepID=UPI000E54D517|nr:NFACT RNA binding domain-containing protein [Clostridium sp. AM58-1XD]RGY99417.1 fibronectin/fibrinogen-binding protein [Clostridium sp. AM58-1XD]
MAFDGIVIANLVRDMKAALEGGKVAKIAQPEKDELLFTIKNQKETHRLLISASASLPLIYFTDTNKQGPMTAPNFCMLLRKHIGNARIITISQPGLERVIEMEFEHLDELGDLCRKRLMIEMMGKHSNIIFCKEDGTILDGIKHVSVQMSSVREVLPGRQYFIPQTVEKENPLAVQEDRFIEIMKGTPAPLQKALYQKFTGISPVIGTELAHLASIDGDIPANELSELELIHLYHTFALMMDDIKGGRFCPNIICQNGEPVEFSSLPLTCFDGGAFTSMPYSSVSELLDDYYSSRNTITRIKQKSSDLRKIVQTLLERSYKKYDLQLKQLKDTEKRDKYKVYGELINTYGYELSGGEKELRCLNYYTNEEIKIPLDPQLSPKENAQKHFDKYNKLKRTFEALTDQTRETKQEIDHLESISTALDIALKEDDLVQIKEELMEYGYVKKRPYGSKRPKITSRPYHYISTDGFHIYVGKNNYQNEEVTFKLASGNDWWFHAKGIPGSHVIVKSEGKELPDRVFEEAGAIAAYYSKGRSNDKVEIDYVQRKSVKKVTGGAPGFVIYHTNYSLVASPSCNFKEV